MKFYFTYGVEGQPYVGGWTIVQAADINQACAIFRIVHPDKEDKVVNCGGIYSEEQFLKSSMATEGNFGKWCHEEIGVVVTIHDPKKQEGAIQ